MGHKCNVKNCEEQLKDYDDLTDLQQHILDEDDVALCSGCITDVIINSKELPLEDGKSLD